MASQVVTVMVIGRNTRKGISNQLVKLYGANEVRTDSNGKAVFVTDKTEIDIYVNGSSVYSGYTSKADNPIIYEKS